MAPGLSTGPTVPPAEGAQDEVEEEPVVAGAGFAAGAAAFSVVDVDDEDDSDEPEPDVLVEDAAGSEAVVLERLSVR